MQISELISRSSLFETLEPPRLRRRMPSQLSVCSPVECISWFCWEAGTQLRLRPLDYSVVSCSLFSLFSVSKVLRASLSRFSILVAERRSAFSCVWVPSVWTWLVHKSECEKKQCSKCIKCLKISVYKLVNDTLKTVRHVILFLFYWGSRYLGFEYRFSKVL